MAAYHISVNQLSHTLTSDLLKLSDPIPAFCVHVVLHVAAGDLHLDHIQMSTNLTTSKLHGGRVVGRLLS